MRENASRFSSLTCRLKATRLVVSMCCALLGAATAANAATDFSDYSVFTSASSTTVSTIKIGATTDSETAITANATATGDDITGNDDEDGVTVPASIVTGTSGSLTINVTNTSGATVYLNAWIDFNRNGVLTDSGEQIATNTLISTGISNSNRTVSFTVPATASIGTAGVRVRLTSTSTPGSTGLKGNGEVEDYITTIDCPTVTLSPTTPTVPSVGTAYSQSITASGSSTAFTYEVTSGTLPAGLALSTAGVLSGTPTSTAATTFTVTATGANSCTGSRAYTITPVCPTVSLSPAANAISDAFVDSAFSQTITASGGTSPYTYAVSSGTLPTGLTLSSAGVLSGTPTSSNGTGVSVTIRATDDNGCQGSLAYTIQVCPAISISPDTLPNPGLGAVYNQTVSAAGSATAITYAIATGSLPSGLTLNTSTGVISGIPTSTTAASFTVSATDANGCQATRSYSLTPATTDYGDFSSFGSASSNYNSKLKLGALFDAESDATTDATATGDDLSGSDDEDGVTLPAYIVQGTSGSMTVNITNTTGATAYLNAWIDYNNNGVLTDSGEQIATNTTIATGISNTNRTLNFTVPSGATTGNVGLRVRLTSTSSPGSIGASGNGEVEDYVVNILPPTDFGDDSSFDVAGSTTATSVRMGALVDSESASLANAAATGDDTNGSDDEDGVTLPATVIQGQSGVSVTVNVTNTSGADAFLNGWIDFNNNGLLTDVGEQIIINDVVTTGTSGSSRSFTFTVPSVAATTGIGARFRLSSVATPGDTGIAGTGEVEDYIITVQPASDHGDFSRFADASSYNSDALTMGDLEDTEITAVTNLAATGDDITNFNDEDGVTLQAILVQGQAGVAVTVKLNNTTGAPAYLNGWVDFNNNGVVTDAGEQVVADAVVDDGTAGDFQTFYFDVPSNATVGTVGARFRLTSIATPGPTGASGYGEVEDYTTSIVAPSSNFRDYFYTIRAVGTRFYLDEISVYNPNSSTPTVSVNPGILDLNAASPGFNTSATDAMINGLALDWLNRRFYWAATSTGSSGYNFNLYTAAYDNVSKTWSSQLVTGSARTNVAFNTGSPVSGSASSGAFPRAAFYNGEYYAGGQLSNNVAVWHLNSAGVGLNSPAFNDYTNFFHRSQTFNGGDFVIRPQDGLLVTSTVISSANTLFNQFISDGTNASGPAASTASVDSQIPYSSNSSVQIAGVGGVSRLYALGATGTNIYRIDRYDTTTPNAVKVGPLPTASYTDLSEGISSSVTSLGVKGIVYNDLNGLADGLISGTGTNASGQLFAMLVDGSGNLVDSFPVKSDGTFILGGATANTSYKVVLSTSYGSLGSTAPAADLPTGWLNAGEFLGSGAGSDGTVDGKLSVTVGTTGIVNAILGISKTLSIGDQVWNDVNNNGLQDSGESGIGGVTVQLWAPGSDNAIGGSGSAADTLAATTTTDGTGAYSFVGLTAGQYFVTVTPPTLYSVVSSTAAGDNGVNGDNNGSQPGGRGTAVYSPIVTLTQGAEPGNLGTGGDSTEDTIDFGLLTAVDYGDNASFGSAGSNLSASLFIGALTDSEYSANTNASATGDDLAGLDDEDGVLVPAAIYQGTSTTLTVTLTNTSGASAFLNAWVDFNDNGILTDSGEQIASNTLIANGTNGTNRNITFTTPATTVLDNVGIRVRLTSVSTPGSTGNVGNGEVEDYIVSVCPAVTVSPATLPTPTVGTAYSQTFTASGGVSPYTYTVSSGALPAWATLSSAGVLSGTPGGTAAATFTVKATDSTGCAGTLSYTLSPVCPAIAITQSALTQGTVGTSYSQTLSASGGVSPYSAWAITSGTLPTGLTLNASTGVISGTPTVPASPATTLTVRVNDANGCQGLKSLTLQICPVVTVSTTTLPAAIQGAPYSQTLASTGGASAYAYTIASGSLPAGLTLSSAGIISGTPTTTGTVSFTVRTTDANGCAGTSVLSITTNLPVTDFGDYPTFPAASQTASTEIRIGTAATDVEPVNPTTGTANADDTTGTDDEDLVIPSVVSGGDLNLNIPATLSGSVTLGRIGVWADWNEDGDTLDANETVSLTSTGLIGGNNTVTATFSPPAGTTVGTKYLRIVVIEGTAAPVFSGASALKGEVEDYAITVTTPTLDYGDLPDTIIGTSASNYQTLSNDNGPAHIANSTLRLGATVDAEGNGQPNSTATGDGADDDGVPTLPTLTQNVPASLTINATNSFGSAGFLKAWIDWNNDGNLTADEELGAEISVPNGTSNGAFNFNFTVPSTAVIGANLGLRVRLASTTIPASNGVVGTGEVEDYLVTVNASTVDFGDYPNFASASRVASTLIKIGTNATDVETSNPTSGSATADDTTGTDDEELTMPTLQVGNNGTLTIPVTLASPVTSGKIAVFADWNGDNDVLDSNESVTLSTSSLVTGANTITATLSPPAGTTGGVKFLRIIATEGASVPTFSGSSTLRGEVEDYAVTVNAYTLDFGDLPDTGTGTGTGNYQTLSSDSGPSHTATSTTLRLGAAVDAEADGQPNTTATGDGADEDGISIMPVFSRGQAYTIPISVFNNTGSTARIFGFIDWNNDGDFADAGETLTALAVSSSASQQSVSLTGTTPGTAVTGTFGARFRLATATTLTSTGTTGNGEVEDYIVTGACPTLSITPASLPATTQYASYNQTLSSTNGTAPYTWTITTGALPGGVSMSSAGVISGTVTSASGAYVFTAKATDANGCFATQSYTISVGSGGMSVGNLVFLDENNNGLKDSNERGIPNVPVEIWSAGADGRVNSADDQAVTSGNASVLSSGGMLTAGTYGTIAPGFSTLTARTDWTGLYQFTELPTGVYYLKITPPNKAVFTSKYGTGTTTYSLNLDFPLASSTAVLLDNGIDNDNNGVQTAGSFVSSADVVVAGVGAAVYSMPFTLATATEPGTSNLGSDEYTLDMGLRPCPAIGITPLSVPAVSSGVAYSTALSAAGGVAPYSYAITQGTLPSGLNLSSAGVISGTTSTVGTSAITVRATDARGCQGFTTIQLSVTTAMSITTASLPNGTEGTAYTSTTLAATGGSSPYQNWRVSSGALPTGLSINSSTGVLSGTPTSPGTYVVTFAVDDALVTPASVTVTNGSVETDAWSAITFTPRTSVTGWTLGNGALSGTTTAAQIYGINDGNANNSLLGQTPAGLQYLASPFVDSWASQTVSGFTVGRPYTLRVRYAMRGAFANPSTTEAQPPFYSNALWIAGYNASAASLFGPASVNFPAPNAANYDNWATFDMPFVPQTSSLVFSYGLDGMAIDDVQFIPTVAATTTATKQFTFVIAGNRDWGDLPDTGIGTGTANYQTANNDSGPSHYRNSNLRLGATLDIESDGQPDATSTGDDLSGTDDEDAIASLPVFARGQSFTIPVSLFNNTGTSANVFAFIDWNNDGDFLDPSEALSPSSVSSGASQQSVNVTGTVPGTAVLGQIGLRVRLSTAGSLGAFGIATNGEVEDYLITPTCPAVALSPASLAGGTLSLTYSQTVTASGGTAPYTYALSSGTLPSGVTLNATTGVLSGTPNFAGTFNFTLSATDANGCVGTKTYAVVMTCPTLSITPATLTPGTVGTAFSQTLAASGGASPYGSWTVISGALPAGLTLNASSGVISGTPTAGNGSGASFTVRTTDANGCQGTQAVTLKICPVVTVNPTTLTAATANSAYSQAITASGGATAYTYTVSSGTLPTGLSLSSAGVLSGTPTSTASFTFTITATDANGCPGSRSYTLAPSCPLIVITPATATRATVGTAYSQTLSASGGQAPYGSWAVTSGTLPTGLTLNASTGVISGTPTTSNGAGTSVTFRVTDANGCTGSQTVLTQICPVIAVSPSTLTNGTINSAYSQSITASGGASPYTYAVSSGSLPAGLTLSSTGVLSGTPTSTTAATFTVAATDANGCSGSSTYTVTPAPDSDFSDYSLFSNASSRMNSTLRIGALTDVEATPSTNSTATGDDTTGSDDEDGVTLPASITQGGASSITVNVTNTSGATAYLNAWIDFNQNGSLADAGEQIATNILIVNSTSNSNRTVSFTAPASAELGSAGVRVRLTSTATPSPTGASGNGEVEDNVANIVAPTTDYGDFSLFADAYSTGNAGLMLGALQDLEGSATKDASAQGDDITGSDDEDGVSFPSMTAGQPMTLPVTVTNLTGSTAYLNAWIDYNNNGVLTDAGEQIATNVNIITGTSGGTVNLNFNVPTNAVTAAALIGARFRLTNVQTPGSTSGVGIGEVEDHTVVILAPLTDFGDFNGAPSVSNTASTNLRLGALVDTEYAATTDATATGDDLNGVDDEDGVTLPTLTAGAPAVIPVVATNNTGAGAYLNAWIDYNNNGVFTDSGEQIAMNTAVASGTTNSTYNLNITVPASAVTGTNVGVRVRISSDNSPGSTGAGGVGEVEDYVVKIAQPTTDFGDYSLFSSVSSTTNSRLRLGALMDTEYAATTNATASGDDITGSDDEDGVTFPDMIAGAPATVSAVVTNTTGATAYLNAWIDFNGNGVLSDPGEQIAVNTAVATGTSNSSIGGSVTIPATTLTGVPLGARVMLTSASSPGTSGSVGTGEIEDYLVTITAPTTDFGDFSSFADASQGVSPSLRMGASVDAEYVSTRNSAATGDDLTGDDDEDGVTLPSMIAGQTRTIPVVASNSSGAMGYLNAWIDFNNDGTLAAGEQIATNVNVPDGSDDSTFNINFTVPSGAVTGTNLGARFRLSAPTSPGPTGANAAIGEVEDYVVNITAPTLDFSDFSRFENAASTANSKLRLGTLVDAEPDATTNAAATGDDTTGSDDEDGVTIPTLTAGLASTITAKVTNSSGSSAYLNAWIDYNNNGVLSDSGEQIATNTLIVTGTSNASKNITFTVPANAAAGTPVGVRVRLTSMATPGSTGTSTGSGEVEDYVVSIVGPTTDYGDWSGIADASNTVVSTIRLGALIDAEFSATKNTTATGDDITNLADEDGVVLPAMTAGGTYSIPVTATNTSGSTTFLNAWADFNNNGSFADAGEQFANNVNVATGQTNSTISQSITVPATAVTGSNLGVRFRLTSTSSPGSTGTGGGNGEVEDYVANIAAPTTDFGDFTAFGSASSTMNSNLRLGALTDTEFAPANNLTATGDDTTGVDDEDGVTLPSLTAGAPATLPVIVTNNTGSATFLNAWIDFNNNGVLTDAGEQIATNVSIATGATSSTQNLSITVPANAVTGSNLGVRFRLTSVSTPGSTGAAGSGEVEDYIVSIISPPLDYGDWSGIGDAASTADNTLRLGALVDTEYGSTRNVSATGDDTTGSDDEDGVTLPTLTAGAPATIPVIVTNTTGSAAFLNVWIDYNNNGVLTDAGEQIATNVSIATGASNSVQNLSITVPAGAVTGSNVGVRVRLTDVPSPGVTGTAGNGEVEDYVTTIAVPTTDFGDWSGVADASSLASSNLRMGALADTEYASTLNATATGDDSTGSDDEDGVTVPSQTPGTAGSATVVVTNNTGAAGYLNAWIDFNNNGSFTDAGEQIATNTSIATGTNGVTQTVNFIVPVGAIPGQRGARFRLTSTQNPTSVGASGMGEVEDYLVTITCLPIALSPSTLTTPTVGTSYTQTVTASGGLAPYTYAIGSGTLPAGLTLSSAGVVSGTPTSSSAATFSIVATDSYGCTGSNSYTVTPVCPTITVNPSTLPSGTVGTSYAQTLTASGGTAGYTFAVSSGTLPSGLTLNASTGLISGTPSTSNAGGVSLTFRATDANGCTGTRTINLIICPVITLTPATLPAPTVGTAYSQTLAGSGGAAAYTFSLAGGSLPAWATLSPSGVLSGTPTSTTAATFTVRATDANGCTGTLSYTITPVCPTVTITPAALAQGTVGTAYSQTLAATGGTAPYSAWTVIAGTLPAGLSLNAATGVLSGTPTATASPATTITVRVNDANGCQGTRSITLQVCPVITLSPTTVTTPVIGVAYSQSLSASSGTSPYSFTLASGSLPAWATLSSAGVITGTPANGTPATFSVRATDANGCTGTASYTLAPNCPTISLTPTTTAQATVGSAYSQTLTASGGTAPYSTWTVTSGTLPAGLTLNASTGVISGTPTTSNAAGVSVSIRTTDANGCQGTQVITVQVCPVITLSPTTPATPTVSTAYSQTFTATGGAGSYTFTLAGGTLPTWATLSSAGILSGVPDSPTPVTFTLKATDANGCTGTQSYTITPACPTMTITPLTAATGTVGIAYSQTLTGGGGTAPYAAWTVTNGTLPAGLTLNSSTGVISGTPTASTGAATSVTVRSTDARGCQVSAVIAIKVCPVITLSPATLAASTAGTSYSQTITASGGVAAYVYTVSSGALPAGLTLSSAGALAGTPTSTATASFTITATDANGCTGTRNYSLTPACPTIAVSPSTLPNGMVNSAYSQTVTSSGGVGTMTYSISSGSLPAGLSLNATSGVISGIPTSTTAASFTVRATDSNNCTGSTAYTITLACPTITVTPATLTTGTVGVAYTQTLSGAGGIAPYAAWTVTSGTLPAGLTLNASSGIISGTPTTSNGTGVSVTIRTTDANGCQGSSVVSLKICPVITQSPVTLATPVVGVAYSQSITPAGGLSPYTFTLASGSLPSGMTLSSSGTISGTTTSVSSATFTVRASAADGCSGTATYSLAPVCPALSLTPTTTLPIAYLGASYSQTLTASGGTAPYTYALQSGDLPGGVLISSSGILSGIPTAKGSFPITVRVTDANSCAQSFNITLEVHTLSIGNLVFEDSNNNGLKDNGEPGVANATVQLFTTGDDNAIGGSGTAADVQIGADFTTTSSGAYLFSSLPAGNFYIKVTPPVDYLFTGGTVATADNNTDNNNDGAQPGGSGTPLFSPVINLSGGAESITDGDTDPDTNLTVDFGLWSSVAVGNFIFLDINGDGRRNEGESLGNIYVELYAQGATPGVDDPVSVGTSGCSCKGRYYLEGLNPGSYFLHIPASQFTTGSPLEGLFPMSSVVAGDDDVGQDLLFNNSPAVNGASTGLFTLRPGFCPVGAAESGAEGSTDDDMDASIDLTRDLGIVAPAGTGFAASTAIRRYIVTGGFTASVLPGASTFATWSQDSNIGGATADPDEDGIANLLEYALGTDPASPLQPNRFALTHDATTGTLIALLTLPSATHDDLIISLETLTDLSKTADATAWKKLTMAATTTLNADGTLTRSYSNLEKLLVFKGLDAGYIRLHVDLDANRDGVPEATVTSGIQGWSRQSFAAGSRTFSMPLLNAVFFTGRVGAVSANEVMLQAIITLPAGSFYLETLDGPLAGQRFEIDATSSSGNTVVLQNTSQSYAGLANARISIRQHHTLGELLPSAAFSSEDRVLFFDPAASNYTTLTNSNGYWLSDVLSMNARPFAAHEAAMVQVRGAGNTLMFTGEVRLTNYVTPLVAGTQLVAPGWPVATPAPVNGLTSGLTPDAADRFRLWDGDTTPDASSYTGYYLDGTTTPPAWLPQTTPAPAATVQPFHGFFLIRSAPLQLNQSAPW
ncbi:putative Ig domain-containing protein [Prosthecobacter sp.]|uniref:putative Ig domain-containing protein n=1 Tax=Prosthecobacter sp. TaxID=1965333 RepID=UPI00378372CD